MSQEVRGIIAQNFGNIFLIVVSLACWDFRSIGWVVLGVTNFRV